MKTKKNLPSRIAPLMSCMAAAILLGTSSSIAQPVIVESRTTDVNNPVTPCPPYCEAGSGWYGQGSSAKSSAPGTNPARLGSRFAYSDAPSFTIQPTLIPGTTYTMDITHVSPNSSPDIVVNITYVGCSGSASSTTAFQTSGANTWENVGTITVNAGVTEPQITFTYASGTLASTGGRWYVDAFRFTSQADPCTQGLPALSTVNGPLAAGQTFVDVPGVDAAATAVKVYADGNLIGTRNSGLTEGVNRVDVSPLVKGAVIAATQVNAAQVESCRFPTGPTVGGGANPRIRVALSIRQKEELTGPIGADGGTTGTAVKFLGATNTFNSGYGLAPMGNRVIQPDGCWQTVTFLRGEDPANPTDPVYTWSGATGAQLLGDYGILDAIAFAIDDLSDTGPFRIYIDNLMNGAVVIQDFESATNGENTVLFREPSYAHGVSPFDVLLAPPPGSISPNISQVTDAQADTGGKSLLVSWQFKDSFGGNWLRLAARGSGTPNPQIDLSQPISFRILIQPAGQTNFPLRIGTEPNDAEVATGSPAVLQVGACGTGLLTYQWYRNSVLLAGATNNVLQIPNAQPADSGGYYAVVTDANGSITSRVAMVTVEASVFSGMMTQLWVAANGSRQYLAEDDQQTGLAYNPISNYLLLASRTGGDGIRVITGNDGFDERDMNLNPAIVTGGVHRVNLIGVTSDGSIYAGNLTADASQADFKLYKWWDEVSGPLLSWNGNPGGAADANRWGDTMDVRDSTVPGQIGPQVILGSRADNKVAVLTPETSATTAQTFVVSNAPAGAFAHGIAWGANDTFWGKSLGGALYHVALDLNAGTATVLHVYHTVPSLAALEVDIGNKLLAAISIGAPDTIKLFDISNPDAGPIPLDTAPFPTDNPNVNALGALAFGTGRVYGLDCNNGIVAMDLKPYVRAMTGQQQLSIDWTGPGILESATEVNGIYTPVSGATSPYPVDTSAALRKYFRVRKQ